MSEIKVGEYVRTEQGLIAQVCAYQDLKTYDDKGSSATFHSFDTDKGSISDIEVKKHSPNIIDLIEVGDYVNDYKVYKVTKKCIYMRGKAVENKSNLIIETIVTKEQFSNIEYKVGN